MVHFFGLDGSYQNWVIEGATSLTSSFVHCITPLLQVLKNKQMRTDFSSLQFDTLASVQEMRRIRLSECQLLHQILLYHVLHSCFVVSPALNTELPTSQGHCSICTQLPSEFNTKPCLHWQPEKHSAPLLGIGHEPKNSNLINLEFDCMEYHSINIIIAIFIRTS